MLTFEISFHSINVFLSEIIKIQLNRINVLQWQLDLLLVDSKKRIIS